MRSIISTSIKNVVVGGELIWLSDSSTNIERNAVA